MTVTNDSVHLYHYKCEYYNAREDEIAIEEGITAGLNYSAAARYVEEFYGLTNIVSIFLCETFIVLSYDEIKDDFDK